jgi:hypothetical protein
MNFSERYFMFLTVLYVLIFDNVRQIFKNRSFETENRDLFLIGCKYLLTSNNHFRNVHLRETCKVKMR